MHYPLWLTPRMVVKLPAGKKKSSFFSSAIFFLLFLPGQLFSASFFSKMIFFSSLIFLYQFLDLPPLLTLPPLYIFNYFFCYFCSSPSLFFSIIIYFFALPSHYQYCLGGKNAHMGNPTFQAMSTVGVPAFLLPLSPPFLLNT